MLNPGGDIEDLYRDFAKNYPLKTDDSGWDEFLQKMESAPVKNLPDKNPGSGNPFAGIITKYRYWLAAAVVVAITGMVLLLNNKKENPAPSAAASAVAKNAAPLKDSSRNQHSATTEKVVPASMAAAERPGPVKAEKKEPGANPLNVPSASNGNAGAKQLQGGAQKNKPVTKLQDAALLVKAPKKHGAEDHHENPSQTKSEVLPPQVNASANDLTAGKQGNKVAKPADEKQTKDHIAASKPQKNKATRQRGSEPVGTTVLAGTTREPKETKKQTSTANATKNNIRDTAENTATPNLTAGSNASDSTEPRLQPPPVAANGLDSLKREQVADTAEITANNNIAQHGGDTAHTAAQPTLLDSLQNRQLQATQPVNNILQPLANAERQTDSAPKIQPLVKISTRAKKYFYIGLTAGPDFSTIKFQTINNTGSNFGLQFGVYLGNNFSIESGLLFAAKKYYTSGAYFKNGIISAPDRDELQSVNSSGHFLEIPVTARYDLVHKKRFKIFVNGGFSSYFTSNERYDFLFHRLFGYELRREESDELFSNIFSLMHISAGFELKLNAANALRFEPYLKLPLSGIGAGSLPVTSSGFYINFTHSFLK